MCSYWPLLCFPSCWLPPVDKDGFLAIKPTLQSDGGPPEVFAAGDVASCAEYPRPKAGVFAVRQVGLPDFHVLRCCSRVCYNEAPAVTDAALLKVVCC
jgi:hypothetical protein